MFSRVRNILCVPRYLGSRYVVLRASLSLWPNYTSVPSLPTANNLEVLAITSVILNMQETWSSIISIMIAFWVAQPYYGVRLAYRGAHRDAVYRFRSWLGSFLIIPWTYSNKWLWQNSRICTPVLPTCSLKPVSYCHVPSLWGLSMNHCCFTSPWEPWHICSVLRSKTQPQWLTVEGKMRGYRWTD